MRVIIDKLETGHLITVMEGDEEIKKIGVGKCHAVLKEVKRALNDVVPRKKTVNTEDTVESRA